MKNFFKGLLEVLHSLTILYVLGSVFTAYYGFLDGSYRGNSHSCKKPDLSRLAKPFTPGYRAGCWLGKKGE